MNYFPTDDTFESLKQLEGDFPPCWSPFVLYGKDNNRFGIGCTSEVWMRDDEYKKRMSEISKETFRNGRVHPRLGVPCPENVKKATALKNSRSYNITLPDGEVILVNNLYRWCKDNGHIDIAFHRAMREGRLYKKMSYEKLA